MKRHILPLMGGLILSLVGVAGAFDTIEQSIAYSGCLNITITSTTWTKAQPVIRAANRSGVSINNRTGNLCPVGVSPSTATTSSGVQYSTVTWAHEIPVATWQYLDYDNNQNLYMVTIGTTPSTVTVCEQSRR